MFAPPTMRNQEQAWLGANQAVAVQHLSARDVLFARPLPLPPPNVAREELSGHTVFDTDQNRPGEGGL